MLWGKLVDLSSCLKTMPDQQDQLNSDPEPSNEVAGEPEEIMQNIVLSPDPRQQNDSPGAAHNVSPWVVRPLPLAQRAPASHKCKKKTATLLTGSPHKAELEAKAVKRADKAKKEAMLKSAKQELRKAERKKAHKEKNAKAGCSRRLNLSKSKASETNDFPDSSSGDVLCPGCDERFEELPTEEWIQCSKCKIWWHELCSNYEGNGLFTCDLKFNF